MGKKLFISKTYYDRFKKYTCPLNLGYWHYSPNGCCFFTNDSTHTIHHLYLRETCSLSVGVNTVQELLQQLNRSHDDNDDDEHNTTITQQMCGGGDEDERFLKVNLQPYLNTNGSSVLATGIDQRILSNMNSHSRTKLLNCYDENLIQYWFVVCDTSINFSQCRKNLTETNVHNLVMRTLFGPLVFCSSIESVVAFVGTITNRFIHQQMPLLNNIPNDRLCRKLLENVKFIIRKFPAVNMVNLQPNPNLIYMDSRDLYDVLKVGHSGFITNLRPIHVANETTFLNTWRIILFNFVQELVNIHPFKTQNIRIRSSCSASHFIKGNNNTVIPEFRCNADQRSKCIHLQTRRKEYELRNCNRRMNDMASTNKDHHHYDTVDVGNYTIALSCEGVICRYVLETMVDEYGEEAVDNTLGFRCYFSNSVFEQPNVQIWERAVAESLDIDRHITIKDGSSVSRERIACMQMMCDQQRMNDIHRFCLPSRFLTLLWFDWACKQLKLNVFDNC